MPAALNALVAAGRREIGCAQGCRHRGAVVIAIGRILGERPLHDLAQRQRHVRRERGRRVLEMAQAELDGGAVRERRLAREHLIQDDAGAVDVGGWRRGAAASLLGRHVARGAGDRGRERLRGPLRESRDAEIADLDLPARGQQHVGRLDVAVHHPLRMCAGERATELLGDVLRLGDVKRPIKQTLGEALPLDELGDVVGALIGMPEVKDLHDPGVAEAREQLGLALKALHPRAVLRPPGLDHLDRDRASETPVEPAIDTAKRALTEDVVELIALVECPTGEIRCPQHQHKYSGL